MVSRIDEDDAYVNILKPDMLTKQPVDDKSRRKSDMVRCMHRISLLVFNFSRLFISYKVPVNIDITH